MLSDHRGRWRNCSVLQPDADVVASDLKPGLDHLRAGTGRTNRRGGARPAPQGGQACSRSPARRPARWMLRPGRQPRPGGLGGEASVFALLVEFGATQRDRAVGGQRAQIGLVIGGELPRFGEAGHEGTEGNLLPERDDRVRLVFDQGCRDEEWVARESLNSDASAGWCARPPPSNLGQSIPASGQTGGCLLRRLGPQRPPCPPSRSQAPIALHLTGGRGVS